MKEDNGEREERGNGRKRTGLNTVTCVKVKFHLNGYVRQRINEDLLRGQRTDVIRCVITVRAP
jgi:hypothetical protein